MTASGYTPACVPAGPAGSPPYRLKKSTAAPASHLWKKYRIFVVGIKHPEFEGIRVTPHVYTTLEEIDRFSEAMEDVLKNGIPKS